MRAVVDAQDDLFVDFIRPYVSEMLTFQSLVTDLFALPPTCPPVIPVNQSYVIYQVGALASFPSSVYN